MSIELVKAFILIAQVCGQQSSCDKCPMKDFCGRQPTSWAN